MAYIEVSELVKDYKIFDKPKGFFNVAKSVFVRTYHTKRAVDHINFSIDKGEIVGYIGPNGAGKSTTIKMLSGILMPTEGKISVDGREPWKDRKQNSLHMGVVFGQRSQLFWDLPVEDTFDLFRKIYKVDETKFKRNVEFYVELLDMKEFLRQPVRQLSLGQKMRANIAVALLHDPDIVYLDEPTIGLDVVAKNKIRNFIRAVNEEKHTTVILTTHDMDDIEIICKRLIMIDHGKKLYDGTLSDFKRSYKGESVVTIEFESEDEFIMPEGDEPFSILEKNGTKYQFRYDREKITPAEVAYRVSKNRPIVDMGMQDTDIEYIVRSMYEGIEA